jgi:hypothetical protein
LWQSHLRIDGVVADLYGRFVMEFRDELHQRPLLLVFASLLQNSPKDRSVDGVIRLLVVNKKVDLPLLATMNFIEESACMDGCGVPLFEACLVSIRRDHMWSFFVNFLHDSFLHNLRQMGSHHNWSDVI